MRSTENPATVLVLGSGGREHALAWGLAKSPRVEKIYVAPGNAGTERSDKSENLNLDISNHRQVVEAAQDINAQLVVVGPETPLVSGIADEISKAKILVFGPGRQAAQLEGSKSFAVRFMDTYNIPHPRTTIAYGKREVRQIIDSHEWKKNGLVIKQDGLAAGKGVAVCTSRDEAIETVTSWYSQDKFSNDHPLLFQEMLIGFEVSTMILVDGNSYRVLPYSRDYKRLRDGDEGPNTGGMGTVAPHPLVTPELAQKIHHEIVWPTIAGLRASGIAFRGVLYPGVMVTQDGVFILEYNARFGDSETEAVVPLLKTDVYELLKSVSENSLTTVSFEIENQHSVVVTLAASGYPDDPRRGEVINGLDEVARKENTLVFHAGTQRVENEVRTNGGRVFMVTGIGETLYDARTHAYSAASLINFSGKQYRRDIGDEGLAHNEC